ncbi:hypothetical protein PILCRDRAFT_11517 [Piloderma croceum F 1598]|uniref:HAT C-terminal dimerisation domain-containing protein n=1 Tax=Piloderma croceum (strain F 1598) TaxID=765440 RepID=A0A0C3AVQ8_PILCF|nr:hypothetical protein PILCRDRAFT_11517 [Piloderma croceum F 1598]
MSEPTVSSQPADNSTDPWLKEFNQYLDTADQIPEGQTLIEWPMHIAIRSGHLLKRDHLAIMASSVSSERAFSSAGITISKCRNRLKPDVVEALQCLKFMIKRDLFFRFDPSIAADEMQEEEEAASGLDSEVSDKNGKSWDEMWIVDNDNDEVKGVLGV